MILEGAEFLATIPATDLDRARRFYEDRLGFSPERVLDVGVIYRFGKGSAFFLYPSRTAGAGHTLGSWFVDDIDSAVQELNAMGIEFEEYDYPDLKTVDGVADLGAELAAWFKDSEGKATSSSSAERHAGRPARQASSSQPYALATAAIRFMSGSSSDGGGRVRLPADSLIPMTRSSKPPGVQMNSIRQPASPTVYRCGMSRGPKA